MAASRPCPHGGPHDMYMLLLLLLLSHHKHPGDKLSGHTLSYDYIGELLQLNRLLPYRVGGPFSCANADCIVSGAETCAARAGWERR